MNAFPTIASSDVDEDVSSLLRRGSGSLPLPGAGDTSGRWRTLTDLARRDVVVGRLIEAHADADAILWELTQRRVGEDEWWAVWAAEPPTPRLDAERGPDGWVLRGAKAWCSGAVLCTHALVTARCGEGIRLFAVDLRQAGVSADLGTWKNPGMVRSNTGTVSFEDVPAREIGAASDYLERAGFWHGAIGVAACWLGGAERVADTLRAAARSRPLDPHGLAHLGAVDAALAGAHWALEGAAREVDDRPGDTTAARVRALRVRAVVEAATALTLDRVGRALGAAPMCLDAAHAGAVADVQVYVRQSHAERDLATLGGLVG